TGLGTTIAYQLVELMGGRITLASVPGKGTTFEFTIELARSADQAVQPDPQRHMPQSPHATGTILVAEDTPVNRMVIRNHLEAAGHTVHIVENGREALNACGTLRFDLILLDVQMPVMDGLEAARRIKAMLPDPMLPPIVALTANADARSQAKCMAAGMDDVMTKPIRREILLQGVRRWLGAKPKPAGCAGAEAAGQGKAEGVKKGDGKPPLDLKTAEYEFGDRDMVREIVEELIENVGAYIIDIRRAAARGDQDLMRARAHAIKGGAATMEAHSLSMAAAALEVYCKNGESGGVPEALIARLTSAYGALKHYVENEVSWQSDPVERRS
ncbi:MAG: response regulator, partial [Desulfatitalea sp.]|nr:response regulator [Desulfatitalea sp.]NNK00437.1 response regulator [Desulfatitalea sp.]